MWENDGDADADVVAADEGGVADCDAGNVEETVAMAKNLLIMGVVYGQTLFENESRRSMLQAA